MYLPCLKNIFAHGSRTLTAGIVTQLFEVDPRYFHMQIHPIQKRTADSSQVFLDLRRGTGALQIGTKKTAGTGVATGNQTKIGWIGTGGLGTSDRHQFIFQRLSQGFQHVPVKLRKFIQEKNAVLSQTDFAGAGDTPAADDTG